MREYDEDERYYEDDNDNDNDNIDNNYEDDEFSDLYR